MPLTEDEVEDYKEELYAKCLETPEKIYTQQDLEALQVVPGDIGDLALCIQALSNEKYFKLLSDGNGTTISYQCRSSDDAKMFVPKSNGPESITLIILQTNRYQSLTFDEELIFSRIEEAGRDGIWTRTLKERTKLHDHIARNIFKTLEKRNLIKSFKSVEHPTRIMFIKASLSQSERSTGGAWFTDNELDEELINILSDQLHAYITSLTFKAPSSKNINKRIAQVQAIRALRDKSHTSATPMDLDPEDVGVTEAKIKNDATFPYAASHSSYPTLEECTRWILQAGITNVTMGHEDIQQILDILCWEARIEKVTTGRAGVAYKAVRIANDELTGDGVANGLTEAPCGRCPVFDLCEEGGPVSAANCEYFNRWLDIF